MSLKKTIYTQCIILLAGTLFAWVNFAIELKDYLNNKACTTGCSATSIFPVASVANAPVNPIYTSCFYGAIFFAIAFIFSLIMVKKMKKQVPDQNSKIKD